MIVSSNEKDNEFNTAPEFSILKKMNKYTLC